MSGWDRSCGASYPDASTLEGFDGFGPGENDLAPLDRCLDCKLPTETADPLVVVEDIPTHAWRVSDAFWQCPSRKTVSWEGTHAERMRRLIRKVSGESGARATVSFFPYSSWRPR